MKRLGRIRISSELLLKWLDYTNAEIRHAQYHYSLDSIELLLECDEFPEHDPNIEIPLICPIYTAYQGLGSDLVENKKPTPEYLLSSREVNNVIGELRCRKTILFVFQKN